MDKLEKVIKGLELCMIPGTGGCEDCPYLGKGICQQLLGEDALELLKAQEPIEPIQGKDDVEEDIFCCGQCGAVVGESFLGIAGECEVRHNYCPECGRAVKWE